MPNEYPSHTSQPDILAVFHHLRSMIKTDITIIGGGITGLWLLSLLRSQGYEALLFEKSKLGSGQTLASQGMIHGGLKYNLDGVTGGASETIASMPGIWRQCLAGDGVVDLSNVACLAWQYYLFSDGGLGSRLSAFLGSKAIRGGPRGLEREQFPNPFRHDSFRGVVYEIPDVIIDTHSLVTTLAKPNQDNLIEASPVPIPEHGQGIAGLRLDDGTVINAQYYIFAAGIGNESLLADSNIPIETQRRGLHQVLLKGDLPFLNGHAVSLASRDKPRFTVTSYTDDKQTVWYLGGDLAETGVNRDDKEQIEFARKELETFLPSIRTDSCSFKTLHIDRAELKQQSHLRPDKPSCMQHGNVVVCWPVKLTLVPLLAQEVMDKIVKPPLRLTDPIPNTFRKAIPGDQPWDNLF